MSNRLAVALGVALAAFLTLSAGCTPIEPAPEKNTYDEREFAADPNLAASLDHIVVVHLEPTGTHLGDTGSVEGVDEIPCEITEPTWVSVGVPLYHSLGHWVEWFDRDGNSLLFADGTLASSRMLLEPGRYTVMIHHAHPGVAVDRVPTLFLRPLHRSAGKSDANTAQWSQPYDPGDGSSEGTYTFCDYGNVASMDEGANMDGTVDDVLVSLSDDVSCVDFTGADFSTHDEGGESFVHQLDCNARNAVFRNCNFNGALVFGTLSDSQFINCCLTNVDWDSFTLSGNSSMTGCDLTSQRGLFGLTVAGITLDTCNFAHTSFAGSGSAPAANLQGATIRNCDFTGVNFSGGNFTHAVSLFGSAASNTFASATVAGANFSYVDFGGADLAAIAKDWSHVDFSSGDLKDVNLSGATLTGANFSAVNATAANFSGAVLDQVVAHGASLTYANLEGASLAAAQLGGAVGSVVPATLSFAFMPNVQITDSADCRNVDFSSAHLYGEMATVQGSDLTGANFGAAIVSGMDFSGATLESCSFENAQAVGTKFVGAVLIDAKFDSAYLMGADFTNAVATGAVFDNAAVSTGPCCDDATCSRCDGCDFSELDQAHLCCYSFSEADGSVYAVTFGATILPSDPSCICPDGNLGPCTGVRLVPRAKGPYPPVPPCVPSPFNWCTAPTP